MLALSCRVVPSPPVDGWPAVALEGIVHVDQKPDFCGEACVEMAMRRLGHDVDQDAVFDLTGLDPSLGRGAHTADLVRAVEALGFDPGPVGTWVPADDPAGIEAELAALHADLQRGIPSILCTRFDERPDTTEHFRLITGYDGGEWLVDDPAVGPIRMTGEQLTSLWPLKVERDRWLLIRLRLDPVAMSVPPPTRSPTAADHAQAVIDALGKAPGFTAHVVPPFVVLGDGDPDRLHTRAEHIVGWARDRLEAQLFAVPLGEVWTVWLFDGDASYRAHAKVLFGDEPDTPYGYASGEHRALVMNIGTGGGTLVHEMVHPYVAANRPGCPAWINEGLASLFEQSAERDGRIVGLPNWRLEGLQAALAVGAVPSFGTLAASSDPTFYDDRTGTNYAQSRYLMYWLQEHGALEGFWRDVVQHADVDPTGVAALERAVGGDLDTFRPTWEEWVMGLTFDGG